MFLQVHTLTSYHASLLNRDDAGLAKRIVFGNGNRLRISSQCVKRHWREEMKNTLDLPAGTRSREFFSRIVLPRLKEEKGMDEDLATSLLDTLISKLISTKDDKKDKDRPLFMKQPALFGKPEADFFVELLAECSQAGDEKASKVALQEKLKTDKKNFLAMIRQAGYGNLYSGFDGAMFGRFVTSDILSRTDAAVHVAHPFSVHAVDQEVDYFTVVDDLNRDEETGAAHAGDMELGSGLFYGYVVVDVPLLVSNFTGCEPNQWRAQDEGDVRAALTQLLNAIVSVTPGAKLGSTAPYACAELVLLEAGDGQPRSLANAYLDAIKFDKRQNPMQQSADALFDHLQKLDGMYGTAGVSRVVSSIHDIGGHSDITQQPFSQAMETALNAIFEG